MTVILVAAGRSERFGTPKLLVPWAGKPILRHALDALDAAPVVDHVVLVGGDGVLAAWQDWGRPGRKVRRAVAGGATRQDSVAAGGRALPEDTAVVLVHDAARPFATAALFEAVAEAAARHGAAVPVLPVVDTVKRVVAAPGAPAAGLPARVLATIPRSDLVLAQTPQGLRVEVFRAAQALAASAVASTDDVALVEVALENGDLDGGVRVEAIPGEATNVKITRPSDVPSDPAGLRVGLGHDLHPLAPGRPFPLAGIDLMAGRTAAERFGPAGHSDGDALTHAACDALLSAAGLGDIGQHFPDDDSRHAGRASLEFLREVRERIGELGWWVVNVAAVVHLERPAVAPHAAAIRGALAAALGVEPGVVGLSAKRGEGQGPVGRGEAVAADVVALLGRRVMTAAGRRGGSRS